MDNFEIGIIGMGDMGKLYAREFYKAGWTRLNVCDLPAKYEALKAEFPHYNVLENGHLVSRRSDYIVYSVEAKFIDAVVKEFGPSTKVGAIVGGQTSVKAPEIAAFEKHLPSDVHIVTCHSMHGPGVSPKGQPLVLIAHRAPEDKVEQVRTILQCLQPQFVNLTAEEHDRITADTQAVTHLAFKSMGTAWKNRASFPWADPTYVGGIENVKVAMALRIYGNKWHVPAGLALLNPAARAQAREYARSVQELFALMIQEREAELTQRVHAAAQFVFGDTPPAQPILLSDRLLDEYALTAHTDPESHLPLRSPDGGSSGSDGSDGDGKLVHNSHLSLLAMVDCWARLRLNPYAHLICQTPPFRLWLGITEFLFRDRALLAQTLRAAIHHRELRADDLAFVVAAAGWAQTIDQGNFDSYQARFLGTQAYFADKLDAGRALSARIIEKVAERSAALQSA